MPYPLRRCARPAGASLFPAARHCWQPRPQAPTQGRAVQEEGSAANWLAARQTRSYPARGPPNTNRRWPGQQPNRSERPVQVKCADALTDLTMDSSRDPFLTSEMPLTPASAKTHEHRRWHRDRGASQMRVADLDASASRRPTPLPSLRCPTAWQQPHVPRQPRMLRGEERRCRVHCADMPTQITEQDGRPATLKG